MSVFEKQSNVPLREMKFSILTGKYNVGERGEGRLGRARDKDRERGWEKSLSQTQR